MYKIKSYIEHKDSINESIALTLLIPVLAVAAGKIIGTAVATFGGAYISKSMTNLTKSRFAEKAHDSDIKKLYDLLVSDYPEIIDALEKDDNLKLTDDLKKAGLDKDDAETINKVIDKLRKYHQSK